MIKKVVLRDKQGSDASPHCSDGGFNKAMLTFAKE